MQQDTAMVAVEQATRGGMPVWLAVVLIVGIFAGVYLALAHGTSIEALNRLPSPFRRRRG